jgi:uncharacterized protein (TIGR02246 family)
MHRTRAESATAHRVKVWALDSPCISSTRETTMPTRPLSLALLALTLSACANMPGAQQGPQDAMSQFRTAVNRQDAAGVAGVFKEDARLLPAGKPMLTGKEAIRAYWQGAFNAGVSHIEKTPVEIAVSGDLAVETSTYVVTFKDQQIAGKDTLVWQRGNDQQWRIASDIWNSDK